MNENLQDQFSPKQNKTRQFEIWKIYNLINFDSEGNHGQLSVHG